MVNTVKTFVIVTTMLTTKNVPVVYAHDVSRHNLRGGEPFHSTCFDNHHTGSSLYLVGKLSTFQDTKEVQNKRDTTISKKHEIKLFLDSSFLFIRFEDN